MNDNDAWYSSFVPASRSKPRPTAPPQEATRERRPSLLDQTSELPTTADTHPLEAIIDLPKEDQLSSADLSYTLARRAKSYTDFYHAARSHLKRDAKPPKIAKRVSCDNLETVLSAEEDTNHDAIFETLLDSSHEKYQLYREQLNLSRRHLDSLLEDTQGSLDLLATLSTSFKAVETQTSSFRSRCENLLGEQTRLTSLAENISDNLQYYNYLDPITKRLNAPGAGRLVRGHDFPQMLRNLDECLDYMQSHPKHREASTYQARYRLLLTRALTLIRVHFTTALRETAADVSKRIADKQLNETTMSTLLHAKFRVGASELKQLGQEIQKRAVPPPDSEPGAQGEYQSLMNELFGSYSAARGRLLVPLIRKKLTDLAMAQSEQSDLVDFARSTIGYIRSVCLDEYDLWHEWFEGNKGLYEFLEMMCEPLYDYLRPRTIHETQLPKLCEMCNLIQDRYMDTPDEELEAVDPDQLDFSFLIRPALEDAQTRLVFLAQAVLRDQIERYKPKPADLDYPSKLRKVPLSGSKSQGPTLSGTRETPPTPLETKTPGGGDEDGLNGQDANWRYSNPTSYQTWYPTLKKAIWLLSKIYRLVNSSVFDDLAHQIVHHTTASLQYAATQIASKSSLVDSQLFLLRQLLILKEQIVAFDIEYVTPEIEFDFSSVTNTFWELRERGGLFNPTNLMRLVGSGLMPRVVENMLDAKAELDGRLRTIINDFTDGVAAKMTEPVSSANRKKPSFHASNAVQNVRKIVEKEVPLLRGHLEDYLDEARTQETLVGAVEDKTLQNYEDFFDWYKSKAQANGSSISKKGKGREDAVWDVDTFADSMAAIFGVGRIVMDAEQDRSSVTLSRSESA